MRGPGLTVRDLLEEALRATRANRLRALLSGLGVVAGVATVITALAIGEGARRAAYDEIAALGIENVLVRAARRTITVGQRQIEAAPTLTAADAAMLHGSLPHLEAVVPMRVAPARIDAGGRSVTAPAVGTTRAWTTVSDATVVQGRWLVEDDERSARRAAVLGAGLAARLFPDGRPVGARLRIGGDWFIVVGVLAPAARKSAARSPIQRIDADVAALVPISSMDVALGSGDGVDRVSEIVTRVRRADDVESAAATVGRLLRRRHAAAEFEILVPRELLRARMRTQRTFTLVLVAIGALALVISGIGILNVMLAAVAERTAEIGVRRAVGATRGAVLGQFALEATLVAGIGGAIGVPVGVSLSAAVALAAGWPVNVSPSAILIALALAGCVGLSAGLYPARRAASIDPVDALRA